MVAQTSKQLSQQLLEEQLANTPKTKEPKPIEPALGVGVRYNAQLQKLTRELAKDINTTIMPLVRALQPEYTQDSWSTDMAVALSRLLEKWTAPEMIARYNLIAEQFVMTANANNAKKFQARAKAIGIDVFAYTPGIDDYLQASIIDNTNLIKSIPEKYLQQVESITMSNMRAGGRPAVIQKSLMNQLGVESRRAKTIARDQTAKINGDLSKKRYSDAGFKYFKWQTVQDGRVGDDHRKAQNRETKFGRGIYTLAEGAPEGWPGNADRPNCRCVAIPVLTSEVEGR